MKKKVFAFVLALAMCFALSSNTFAAKSSKLVGDTFCTTAAVDNERFAKKEVKKYNTKSYWAGYETGWEGAFESAIEGQVIKPSKNKKTITLVVNGSKVTYKLGKDGYYHFSGYKK